MLRPTTVQSTGDNKVSTGGILERDQDGKMITNGENLGEKRL
jgi:hypothetical protein